jgi:hypothetical protein
MVKGSGTAALPQMTAAAVLHEQASVNLYGYSKNVQPDYT